MARLGELADEQTPLLADLERAAPDLDTVLHAARPVRRGQPPGGALARRDGRGGHAGVHQGQAGDRRAARRCRRTRRGFAKPLRQFLQTIDDRKRAIETDPRAKATAPPAPDPTAISGEGGFTGMEAIWNYFFWQTLSINMLDDTRHMLRASLTAEPDCMRVTQRAAEDAEPTRPHFDKCNSYLGPNQPGIYTRRPARRRRTAAASVRAQSRQARHAARRAARRGHARGRPAARPARPLEAADRAAARAPAPARLAESPAAAQASGDLKKNPKELRRKLEEIAPPSASARRRPTTQTTGQLLDFLLAP